MERIIRGWVACLTWWILMRCHIVGLSLQMITPDKKRTIQKCTETTTTRAPKMLTMPSTPASKPATSMDRCVTVARCKTLWLTRERDTGALQLRSCDILCAKWTGARNLMGQRAPWTSTWNLSTPSTTDSKWMQATCSLGQDAFLTGRPSSARQTYLACTNKSTSLATRKCQCLMVLIRMARDLRYLVMTSPILMKIAQRTKLAHTATRGE